MSQVKDSVLANAIAWNKEMSLSIKIDEKDIADLATEIKQKQKLLDLKRKALLTKKKVVVVYMADIKNYLKK